MCKRLPKGISLELSEAAKDLLLIEGVDVQNGARPMRRVLTRLLEDPIAELILEGKLQDGDCIVIDETKLLLNFQVRSAKPTPQPTPLSLTKSSDQEPTESKQP